MGIKASGVPRKDIWITSKLFELHHRPEHVEMACRDTLKKLGTDYLDMYLMHYPVSLVFHLPHWSSLNRQVAWQTVSPEGVLPQKEHTPIVDGRLKIDIPLSEDFLSTYHAMEQVCDALLLSCTDKPSLSTRAW